jgi:tRNA (guanine37-N1)-methyltransferase
VRIDVVTIFPGMFAGPLDESILKRAQATGLVQIGVHDLRGYTTDRHRTTDDAPYGGGAGMVMRPEPLFAAVEALRTRDTDVILMSPQGRTFTQQVAQELSGRQHLVLLCGRYEGFDERVRQHLATDALSIGDYVLTGGELPAMAVIDAVVRLLPGVLGSEESLYEESHSSGLLEYPHFTRPPEFRGWQVPDVLLSGNHAAIARWRREQSLLRTLRQRPDLLARAELTTADRRFLAANGAIEYLRPEDAEPPKRRRRSASSADGEGDRER